MIGIPIQYMLEHPEMATFVNDTGSNMSNVVDGKVGECAREWDFSCCGQPRSDAHHIGFGNAYLEKTLREFLLKMVHLQGLHQVGCQPDDVGVLAPELEQALAETITGCFGAGGLYIVDFHCSKL